MISENEFENMKLYYYKESLLVKPHESHPNYGLSTFHNGTWNMYLKGWLFDSKYKGFLVNHGLKI